jgi:hypothetical protein
MAFYRAIVSASLHVSDSNNRSGMAKVLAQPQYLNAPEVVLEQVDHRALRRWIGPSRTMPTARRLSAVSALLGRGLADDAAAALEHAEGRYRLQEACRAGDAGDRRVQDHA